MVASHLWKIIAFRTSFVYTGDYPASEEDVLALAKQRLARRLPDYLRCERVVVSREVLDDTEKETFVVTCHMNVVAPPPVKEIENMLRTLKRYHVEPTVLRAVIQLAEDHLVKGSDLTDLEFYVTEYDNEHALCCLYMAV